MSVWARVVVCAVLASGCAEGGGVLAFEEPDVGFVDKTPPEPETEGDPDAAVKTDVESVFDELVAPPKDDAGPVEGEDAGGAVFDAGPSPFDAGLEDVGPGGESTRACSLLSRDYDAPLRELDAPAGSAARLRFEVDAVPSPSLIARALLRFDTYDANTPTLEGRIDVNGRGALDLPADRANANRTVNGVTVDVTPLLREGLNVVEFGPGPLDRSVFRVGRVSLELSARLAVCPRPESAPDGGVVDAGVAPVLRRLTYQQARYTRRHNVVFRCRQNYAYTARGASHSGVDCQQLYDPDGTLRATAQFVFTQVIDGFYDILVTSRHSVNRNRLGALFIVNGERRRINQRDNRGGLNLATDRWGRRRLSGTVRVVLNSLVNQGSDSVAWVTLRPVP